MPSKRSRVHPPFKTKYRVDNWPACDRALAERGSLTFWTSPEATERWSAKPSGHRGAQPKFSDLAIETALTLRLIFHLPLRQTEGFARSIFDLIDIDLEVPDHTTLSRRSRCLDIELRHCTPSEPLILILDSCGLSIRGEGQWAPAKHGERGMLTFPPSASPAAIG